MNFVSWNIVSPFFCRYAAILFKKQRYVSSQHRMNIKIVCKDNFKYEVQERAATNAVSLQQLAEEYWRIDKFFLISFPILFFIFNIIYWLAFILWISVAISIAKGGNSSNHCKRWKLNYDSCNCLFFNE